MNCKSFANFKPAPTKTDVRHVLDKIESARVKDRGIHLDEYDVRALDMHIRTLRREFAAASKEESPHD